ncbi:MAG: hypothetical protein SFT90_04025 [Rickettsiales bacterium]|nr:hypothetical protein [Rickettsiales bacterium]
MKKYLIATALCLGVIFTAENSFSQTTGETIGAGACQGARRALNECAKAQKTTYREIMRRELGEARAERQTCNQGVKTTSIDCNNTAKSANTTCLQNATDAAAKAACRDTLKAARDTCKNNAATARLGCTETFNAASAAARNQYFTDLYGIPGLVQDANGKWVKDQSVIKSFVNHKIKQCSSYVQPVRTLCNIILD